MQQANVPAENRLPLSNATTPESAGPGSAEPALTRGQHLFAALLQVSARVQTAPTPTEVMHTLGQELMALGMHCAVMLLAEDGSDDGTSYVQAAYASLDEAARSRARVAYLGQTEALKMPVAQLSFWPALVAGGEALYFHSPLEVAANFLPAGMLDYAQNLLEQAGVASDLKGLVLLMRAEQRPLGLLAVWGPQITAADSAAMMLFADQISAALEISRLRQEQSAQRLLEQQALQRFSQALLEADSHDAIFAHTLDVLEQTLHADLCEILLPHAEGGLLLAAARGWETALIGRLHIKKTSDQSQAQFVLHEKKPVAVSDFAAETRFAMPSLFRRQGIRASLSAPMLVRDQALGVISALWRQPRDFDEADERLLGLIANSAAQALARAQLLASAERNALEMGALYETTLALTAHPNLENLLPAIMRRAAELLGASIGALYLVDHEQQLLRLVVPYNLPPAIDHVILRFGEGISGRIALSGETMVVDDYETWPHRAPAYAGYAFHCVAAAPLIVRDQIIGVLNIASDDPALRFSPENIRLLRLFADQAAIAIENARLLQREQEQSRLAEALRQIGIILGASLDLETILDRLLEQVGRIIPLDGGCIFTVQDGMATIARAISYDAYDPDVTQALQRLSLPVAATPNLRQMAESGRAIRIADTQADPGWVQIFAHSPFRSWLGAPILIEDEVIAFFSIEKIEPDFYQAHHVDVLELFIGQARIALVNARLYQTARERALMADRLKPISEALNRAFDPAAVVQVIGQSALALTQAEGAAIYLRQGDHAAPSPWRHRISQVYVDTMIARLAEVPGGALLNSTAAIFMPDIRQLPAHSVVRAAAEQEGLAAIALWPLVYEQVTIAAIGCYYRAPRRWSGLEQEAMETFTRQAAIALENARLFAAERQQLLLSQTLQALGALLTTDYTLAEVLDKTLALLREVVAYDSASVYLFDRDGHPSFHAGRGFGDIGRLQRLMDEYSPAILARFRHHDIQVIADTRQEPTWVNLAETEAIRSWIGAPLLIKGRLIGALNVDSHRAGAFDAAIAQTVMAFANQAAIAIENARLFAEVQQRARHSETLNAIIAAAAVAADLQSLLDATLPELLAAIAAPRGLIRIRECYSTAGLPPACLTVLPEFYGTGTRTDLEAYLHLPIYQQEKQIGDLCLGHTAPRAWTPDEIALAEAAAQQLGAAAERISLLMQTQTQARLMQQLVETVPDGVLWLDAQQRPALTNPAAAEMLAFLGRYDAGGALTHMGELAIASLLAPANHADITLARDGRYFDIASRALTASEAEGEWVLVLREVTEQHQQQEREQQRQRLVAVGQMAAGIAHDFNNILQGIIGFADLLQKRDDMPANARRHLHLLADQGRRGAALVRQILDFSRQSIIDKRPRDLAALARETIILLHTSLPLNIHLSLESDETPYPIVADAAQMQRLLTNLIFNARDAMPQGGAISLRLQRLALAPGDPLPTPELSPGRWVALTVQDSGAGIAPEVLPFIFDPFYTTKGAAGGAGLGLAQVYGIVRQHDGYIAVHSDSAGACFTLYFPLAAAPSSPAGV